jgi:phosphomannomutase / phosphoglucomutase
MRHVMEIYMNNDIFREYDIRGIADIDLTDEVVYMIGRAFGYHLSENKFNSMSISGDVRYTTDRIKKSFINGVISQGVDVTDMGVLPTPVNYFSLYNTNIVNSVQVTGSHNPSDYNGLKISFNKKPFFGEMIQYLKTVIDSDKFYKDKLPGKVSEVNIINDYYKYMIDHFNFNKKIKVVMDCGNAVGGIIAPKIYKDLGIEVYELYCDVDPNFPNHHPDPTVDSNLDDIINIMKTQDYDIGIAFDGDADRIVAVDNKGRIIRADILLSIIIPHVVEPNDTVIYDVKCSKSLEQSIAKVNAIPIMWNTGHSLIKNKMIESGSKIGGEMSGHIFFADKYFGFDDGIYVGLRLIEILLNGNYKLSDLFNEVPSYISTPEIRIDCNNDAEKDKITSKMINFFTANYNCETIDGIRIKYTHGWALVRSSNTQPVIVCRFESDTKSNLDKIKTEVFSKLSEYGEFNLDEY